MRTNRAIGVPLEALNLEFLIADLLAKQRDKLSTVAKALNYRAKDLEKGAKDKEKAPKG
jgi:hypothetical protein